MAVAPLMLEREIALPDVKGRIDHLAVDSAHHRLFVAEIANGSVDIINLDSGARRRITGLAEPQGVAYLPALDQVVVACGGEGSVRFYNAATLALVGLIRLGDDADNVRVDGATGQIAVGYGSGTIALIDPARIDHAFICGPYQVNDEAEAALLAAGVAQERIHIERFGVAASGTASAQGAVLHQPQAGDAETRHLVVFDISLQGKLVQPLRW
jgi:hypothetical protein